MNNATNRIFDRVEYHLTEITNAMILMSEVGFVDSVVFNISEEESAIVVMMTIQTLKEAGHVINFDADFTKVIIVL